MMRRHLVFLLTLVAALAAMAGAAQAVVLQNSLGTTLGVAMVPTTGNTLAGAGVHVVTASGVCQDPQLRTTPDLGTYLPAGALCLHDTNPADGHTVLPQTESFALTWDPEHRGWDTTRGVMEQFLRDVADGSGQYTSEFSLTSQYTDATGARAQNSWLYGGGCVDYGDPGGYTCQYGNTTGEGVGQDYPTGDAVQNCSVSGQNYLTGDNVDCITDAAIRQELVFLASTTQVASHVKRGYSPLLVLMTPPNVEVCTDSTGKLCSASSTASNAAAQFCSYHSYVTVGGVKLPYVVQPFTADTSCDEDVTLPTDPTTVQVETWAAQVMVNPLSQGLISSTVNPWMDGWFANDGSEIDDNPYLDAYNGCQPEGKKYDTVTVGSDSWVLQREFNNGSTLAMEPNALACAPWDVLNPAFVVPSAVDPGDVLMFDGSSTDTTEVVPNGYYWWNFGDGSSAIGASVEHAYAKPGTYTVTLTVIDRGGNHNVLSQLVTVSGSTTGGSGGGGTGGGGTGGGGTPSLKVSLSLRPVGLRSFLRSGLSVWVSSNMRADGVVRLVITSAAARRAHIKVPRGQSSVVVGTGTVSGLIKQGKVTLHLQLARAVAAKLAHAGRFKFWVRLSLVAAGGLHDTFVVPGQF